MENIDNRIKWILGTWEGIHGNGIYHEEWKEVSQNELIGKAYLIRKGEIVNPEKLKLHCDESGIFYTADVAHNPKPVSFRLTQLEEGKMVFENPEHDFPKKITYIKEADNSLRAIVEAGSKSFEYRLKKSAQEG